MLLSPSLFKLYKSQINCSHQSLCTAKVSQIYMLLFLPKLKAHSENVQLFFQCIVAESELIVEQKI